MEQRRQSIGRRGRMVICYCWCVVDDGWRGDFKKEELPNCPIWVERLKGRKWGWRSVEDDSVWPALHYLYSTAHGTVFNYFYWHLLCCLTSLLTSYKKEWWPVVWKRLGSGNVDNSSDNEQFCTYHPECSKDDCSTKLSLNLSRVSSACKVRSSADVISPLPRCSLSNQRMEKKEEHKIFIMPLRPIVKGPCVRIKCDEYPWC